MTSADLKKEVERAGGSPPPAAGRAAPGVDEEEEEHTAQHVLELVDSRAVPSSSPASSSPVTEEDELEDSITATAPTIDPQTRAPMFDAAKLAAVRIEIPAEPPRPPSLPPRPAPVAPSPVTQASGGAQPLEPIEPIDETEARTVPGRSPADDEPPTAQGLVAPLTPRSPVNLPLSAVPSTEPAIEDDDGDPTAHGVPLASQETHPADEDDAPTGQGPAPAVAAAHPADEDDAPTGQGPAPAVAAAHPADEDDAPTGQGPAPVTAPEYEPDDSITGLAPNISKLSLSSVAVGPSPRTDEGALPDLTEGTTHKMARTGAAVAELPADALDDDDDEDEATASITAEAPAPMTNMLRVIAAEGAPQRTKPLSAIAPIEEEDLPRDKTAVMASAPLRAAARVHQPTSDSGLRARADSTSGERPSAQLAPGYAVSHPPSDGRMPTPPVPGSSHAFDPPAPWDTPAAAAPRYGALVGFVATVSVCFPIALYFLLRSGAPPPAPPEPARVEVSVNPLASSTPLVKPSHPAPPPPEASASASAPTHAPAPRRRAPVRRGPRRR